MRLRDRKFNLNWLSSLYEKIEIPDLQRYPWNLDLIKNVEDNVVFLTRKVFISVNFSIVS